MRQAAKAGTIRLKRRSNQPEPSSVRQTDRAHTTVRLAPPRDTGGLGGWRLGYFAQRQSSYAPEGAMRSGGRMMGMSASGRRVTAHSRKDEILHLLAAVDRHFAAGDCLPAEAD